MNESFASWLAKSLADRRLRRTAFARQLAVDPSTVARWLSGETRPQIRTVPRLANVLAADVGFVYGLAGYASDLGMSEELYPEEIELLSYFRRLSPEQKRVVLAAARAGSFS